MEAGLTNWVDYLVIAIYFAFVIAVGVLSMRRKNRESVQGYFLAGRSMTWLPIGASLFASNIGTEHFIGLAGSGAASGLAVVSFEWGAVLLLMLLGWVFLPIYLTAGVFTMPEYLGRRFGGTRMRIYLSLVALALYVASKVSVDMYAGVFFIQLATGWDMYLAMIPLLVITAVYTLVGGLAAVVFTDTLQTIVMLIGAISLCIMAFIEVGGLPTLYVKYMKAIAEPLTSPAAVSIISDNITTYSNITSIVATTTSPSSTVSQWYSFSNSSISISSTSISNDTCGAPRSDAWHIFRNPLTSDLPWPGVVFRATFASLWNWCADQVIVQRTLAAKNMAHARGATVLAGYLKFTPLFLIIMPGMISRVLYPDQIGCTDKESCKIACGNEAGCSNSAYPYLILKLAPVGMRGLLVAVMVAAQMSSLTSIFNSAVTVFTMDLWRKARPGAKEKELLIVGRMFVVVLVGVSIAWIPLIMDSQGGQLFLYIQAVTGYIAPPISAIFILAIFVRRINETGAFWGVICGQITGIIRLVLDFVYPGPGCGEEDTRPFIVAKVHFTYFSAIVFVVTMVVAVLVSLITKPQDKEETKNLTFWTLEKQRREKKPINKKQTQAKDDTSDHVPLADRLPDNSTSLSRHTGSGDLDTSDTSDWRDSRNEIDEGNKTYSQWRQAFKRFKDISFSVNKDRKSVDDELTDIPRSDDTELHKVPLADDTYSSIDKKQDINHDPDTDRIKEPGVKVQMAREKPEVLYKFEKFKSYVDQPWNAILNINAVILLSVLAFLCGYFH